MLRKRPESKCCTLDSGIDVGQGIVNAGPGKFDCKIIHTQGLELVLTNLHIAKKEKKTQECLFHQKSTETC